MFDSLPNCFSDEFVLRASELLFYVVFNDNLHHYYGWYTQFSSFYIFYYRDIAFCWDEGTATTKHLLCGHVRHGIGYIYTIHMHA